MFDLAPDKTKIPGNPRNSEGSFLRLNDGRIAFAYSRYSGDSADDHAYAEIACIFSSDEGETFGDERILVRPRLEEDVLFNVYKLWISYIRFSFKIL